MHIRLFQFWLYTTIRRELETLEGDSNAIDAFIRQVSDPGTTPWRNGVRRRNLLLIREGRFGPHPMRYPISY